MRDYQTNPFLLLNLSTWSVLIRDFSGLFDFLDFSRRLSKLFLEASGRSVLNSDAFEVPLSDSLLALPWFSVSTVSFLEPFAVVLDFPIVCTNFFRCLMNSGYSSRLQCPPPLTHKGSYFTLQSSQSCLPWDTSTTSSAVPWPWKNYHHHYHIQNSEGKRPSKFKK